MRKKIQHLRQLLKRQQKFFRARYCLHRNAPAECSAKIVSAHSVQRSMIERHLAEAGHVLQFRQDIFALPGAVVYSPERIGINKATTFFGFCDHHDSSLFSPLEIHGLNFEPIQIALLGYRAFSRELYLKEAVIRATETQVEYAKKNRDVFDPARTAIIAESIRYHKNGRRNIRIAQQCFSDMVLRADDTELRFYAVQFEHPPVYLASTAFIPEWDFEGSVLQDLSQLERFHAIAFSAWASGGRTTAVFCWHVSADIVCRRFIDSLCRFEWRRLSNVILGMAFEIAENVVFKPSWWNSLDAQEHERILRRVPSGAGLSRSEARTARSLLDDGLVAVPCDLLRVVERLD